MLPTARLASELSKTEKTKFDWVSQRNFENFPTVTCCYLLSQLGKLRGARHTFGLCYFYSNSQKLSYYQLLRGHPLAHPYK
jgi:hypothetical protein